MDMRCCQPGSNTADCSAVDPAVYGYASVVTSRPRSRAPRMSWRRSGVSRWPMLVTWTTCKEAPVAAASARSEERRVGKECRSGWAPEHHKKNTSAQNVAGGDVDRIEI